MEEIWKEIKESSTVEVSNFGGLRTKSNKKERYRIKWKSVSVNRTSYWLSQLKIPGQKVLTLKIHRLVAQAFIPNPENKPQVNHIDGDGLNNHVDNLEWVTARENKLHAYATGLQSSKGVKNSRAEMSEEKVFQLCMYYHNTLNTPKMAIEKFNISRQQASKIRARFAWTHISKDFNFIPLKKRWSATSTFNDQSKDVGLSEPKREDTEISV